MRQWLQNLRVMRRCFVRRDLLCAGLAGSLAFLATPVLAQAPQPVASSRSVAVQPVTMNNPRPAQAGKNDKIRAASDQNEPGVHQMVILNGPSRTVHYFAPNSSPGEQAALKQLEQTENELAVNDSLQGLRQQYINTESLMEARRREVQSKLYGLSMNDRVTNSATYAGIGLGQPSPYGTPFLGSSVGWWGTPWANPSSAYDINRVTLRQESEINQSLANGIGDEGQFKRAMVTEMARQANPESATTALRNYETALANLGSARPNGVTAAASETMTPGKVIVTLKDGEKVTGVLAGKDSDWITIRTEKAEERIRMQDVTRIKLEVTR